MACTHTFPATHIQCAEVWPLPCTPLTALPAHTGTQLDVAPAASRAVPPTLSPCPHAHLPPVALPARLVLLIHRLEFIFVAGERRRGKEEGEQREAAAEAGAQRTPPHRHRRQGACGQPGGVRRLQSGWGAWQVQGRRAQEREHVCGAVWLTCLRTRACGHKLDKRRRLHAPGPMQGPWLASHLT